jgi:hypothetical protein
MAALPSGATVPSEVNPVIGLRLSGVASPY